MEAAYLAHVDAGGSEDNWKAPSAFNSDAARIAGQNIAGRATAPDRKLQAKAYKAIKALGLEADRAHERGLRVGDREKGLA